MSQSQSTSSASSTTQPATKKKSLVATEAESGMCALLDEAMGHELHKDVLPLIVQYAFTAVGTTALLDVVLMRGLSWRGLVLDMREEMRARGGRGTFMGVRGVAYLFSGGAPAGWISGVWTDSYGHVWQPQIVRMEVVQKHVSTALKGLPGNISAEIAKQAIRRAREDDDIPDPDATLHFVVRIGARVGLVDEDTRSPFSAYPTRNFSWTGSCTGTGFSYEGEWLDCDPFNDGRFKQIGADTRVFTGSFCRGRPQELFDVCHADKDVPDTRAIFNGAGYQVHGCVVNGDCLYHMENIAPPADAEDEPLDISDVKPVAKESLNGRGWRRNFKTKELAVFEFKAGEPVGEGFAINAEGTEALFYANYPAQRSYVQKVVFSSEESGFRGQPPRAFELESSMIWKPLPTETALQLEQRARGADLSCSMCELDRKGQPMPLTESRSTYYTRLVQRKGERLKDPCPWQIPEARKVQRVS